MTSKDLERRTFEIGELRAAGMSGDEVPKITGHAAVFNQRSVDLGGFREVILPGAFTRAVQEDDVRALFNHDTNIVLGRKLANTLTIREDEHGLAIEIIPPSTQLIRDMVIAPIVRGDISQMSFAFSIPEDGDEWVREQDGTYLRKVKSVKLYEVSPVTFAAYPQTDVSARSVAEFQKLAASAKNEQQHQRESFLARARRRLRLHSAD